jgi:hypothetical protein
MAQEELRKERSRYSAALEIELDNCLAELGWDWKIKSISKYIILTLYIQKKTIENNSMRKKFKNVTNSKLLNN